MFEFKRKKYVLGIGFVFILALFFLRVYIKESFMIFTKPPLPEPVAFDEAGTDIASSELGKEESQEHEGGANQDFLDELKNNSIANLDENFIAETDFVIPEEYNLLIPFSSQAPFGDWGEPYQEACEEASLIMADAFFSKKTLSKEIMDQEIKKLVEWQKDVFGYYEDTTAKEVSYIAKEYFGLEANIDYGVSVENIKKYISQNKLIIVPAAGRILPNPNFTGEGPLYHMLVIRGYTDKYFITNDPGTRNGKEFLYTYNDLINAVHDWPKEHGGKKDGVSEQDMLLGQKVMIVLDKN